MSEARWKAYISGKKYGPVDDETIRQWIAEHRVTGTTQVWRPGMPKWLKAREVSEFSMYFDETVAGIPALSDDDVARARASQEAAAEQGQAAAEQEQSAAEQEQAAAPAERAQEDTAPAEAEQEKASPEAAAASPAPVQAQPLADPGAGMYGDDDAPTVVQASPFADAGEKQEDATIRVQPTAPEPTAAAPEGAAAPQEAAAAAGPARSAPQPASPRSTSPRPGSITKPRPGLPLVPFFLALVALLPAASSAYMLINGLGDFLFAEEVPTTIFALNVAALVGIVLIIVPPLTFSTAGRILGILGGVIALGCWVAVLVLVYLAAEELTGEAIGFGTFFKGIFIEQFKAGGAAQLASGVLSWGYIVAPLLAILYFALSGKYRARARA